MVTSHEFGGQHTDLKLSVIEKYLSGYTTALRSQFSQLWYIDAFAGTGNRTVRTVTSGGDLLETPVIERVDIRRGSAQIALDTKPDFDFLVFIEQNPRYVAELNDLAARYLQKSIQVISGDANAALRSLVVSNQWTNKRAVVFLDPYGMEVEWSTLQALASTKAIDVWFLFPLAGLFRQATRKLTDIDPSKRAALIRMFGDDAWEQELYPKQNNGDLFGNTGERERLADVKGLESYTQLRLKTIFAEVFDPLPLPIDERPQRFSLFLCVSNPVPAAIGLGSRIAKNLLDPKWHLIERSSTK
ncbi:three-Cys-motif partner protein TcmP [Afipia sp. DC4300-2b1]|uniref:three-Cys-motif partner protein TcmP n=1 Tax=Afipia sp. DC4300-2b1 TaxID=2804672 RepID=UPI003CFB6B01